MKYKVKDLINKLKTLSPEKEMWIRDHIEGNDYELTDVIKSKADITDISDGYDVIMLI